MNPRSNDFMTTSNILNEQKDKVSGEDLVDSGSFIQKKIEKWKR